MKRSKLQIMTLILTALVFSCSKNKFTTDAFSTAGGSDQSGQSITTPDSSTPAPSAFDQVDMKSYVDDSSNKIGVNNALSFDIDKTRGEFIIMIPLPSGLLFTPSGSFTNYPDITISPVFDSTGKMKVAVRVPIKYVIHGLSFVPATRLPNGDPLPAMPAGQGELPSLGLSFPQNNTQITLYIGVNALGLFATLPNSAALPIPINITVPIKNSDKSKTYGYLTYVNAKNNNPPGLFISTGVPNDIARILQDHFGL